MAYGSAPMMNSKPKPKPIKGGRSSTKKNNGKIDDKTMLKLKEHSKQHEGGMTGKHMKNMIRFIKEGMSFSVAHRKASKIDKK